jgi:hypothetical protein
MVAGTRAAHIWPSAKAIAKDGFVKLWVRAQEQAKKKVNNQRKIRRLKLKDLTQLLDEFDVDDPNNQLAQLCNYSNGVDVTE